LTHIYNSYFAVPDETEVKWDYKLSLITDKNKLTKKESFDTNYLGITNDNAMHIIDNDNIKSISVQKNDKSRRIIRNLHYLDILHTTLITNTCKSKVSFWQTFIHLFNDLKLEDRFFCTSCIQLCLTDIRAPPYKTFFYHIQQYQPKASIFNPFTIKWILDNILKGKSIFTPVLSWSAYMCAFMHSDYTEYVGTDVIPHVINKTKFLYDTYINNGQYKSCDLYCIPSEDLINNKQFMSKYINHFDTILMCPPYYDMEIYADGLQSTKLYKSYDEWLMKYWKVTIQLCHMTLKKTGTFGIIINDYNSLKKVNYPLIEDTIKLLSPYFEVYSIFKLQNRVSPLRANKKTRTEMLITVKPK
jgi:hypothetical protein